MDRESAQTRIWRDPLSAGFMAHRQLMLLKLRWHERVATRRSATDDA